MSRIFVIEADGGSRGNPGISGSGAVILESDGGRVLVEIVEYGGVATNNVAEYKAVLAALKVAFDLDSNAEVHVRMDSKLVIEQMSGNWKIKHTDMQALAIEVQKTIAGKGVSWEWIPRERNSRADALANEAMDTKQSRITQLNISKEPTGATIEFNPNLPGSVRAPGHVTEPLTTLILVRHGRTSLTESHKISGGSGEDPSLSEKGRADAAAVAKVIGDFGKSGTFAHLPKPTAIISSPMKRTVETAQIIGNAIGLAVEELEELREISFGDWDGHTNAEVAAKWPEVFASWRGSWELSPPNGESLKSFEVRMKKAQTEILERFKGQTVVVVAHVMPIRGFLKLALEAGPSAYWRPQVAPCSVTVLRHWGADFAELVAANFTAHL